MDLGNAQVAVEPVFPRELCGHLRSEFLPVILQRFIERIAALKRGAHVVQHGETYGLRVAAAVQKRGDIRGFGAVVQRIGNAVVMPVEGIPHHLVFGKIDLIHRGNAFFDRVCLHHGGGGMRPAGAAHLIFHGRDIAEVARVPGCRVILARARVRLIGYVGLALGRDLAAESVHPHGGAVTVYACLPFNIIHALAVFIRITEIGKLISGREPFFQRLPLPEHRRGFGVRRAPARRNGGERRRAYREQQKHGEQDRKCFFDMFHKIISRL